MPPIPGACQPRSSRYHSPLAHDDVDLLRRMVVVDVADAWREEARSAQHVASLLEPVRSDEPRVRVAVTERLPVLFRARPPDPGELGFQCRERVREGRYPRRRPRPFERGGKVAVRGRGRSAAGRNDAGRTGERVEDACGGVPFGRPPPRPGPRGSPGRRREPGRAPRDASPHLAPRSPLRSRAYGSQPPGTPRVLT